MKLCVSTTNFICKMGVYNLQHCKIPYCKHTTMSINFTPQVATSNNEVTMINIRQNDIGYQKFLGCF